MSSLQSLNYRVRKTATGERPWVTQGACNGVDPDLFYPRSGANLQLAEAKAICAECPVRTECLEWAIEARELEFGVFGGLSANERQELARRQGKTRSYQPLAHGTPSGYRSGCRCESCRTAAVDVRRALRHSCEPCRATLHARCKQGSCECRRCYGPVAS